MVIILFLHIFVVIFVMFFKNYGKIHNIKFNTLKILSVQFTIKYIHIVVQSLFHIFDHLKY